MARTSSNTTNWHIEGGLLTRDLVARLGGSGTTPLAGLEPQTYGFRASDRLSERTASAWQLIQTYWVSYNAALESPNASAVTVTRQQWLMPLLTELGFGELTYVAAAEPVGERTFAISHRTTDENRLPVHLVVGDLDKREGNRSAPHALIQEYLNRTESLWGVVANGSRLRLVRDNLRISRPAYIEFDLEAMLQGGDYPGFQIMFLLAHRSRLPWIGEETCWLERWRTIGTEEGSRALDDLRRGVENAIKALGQGFVDHPNNSAIRTRLEDGSLLVTDYYRLLLRMIYRMLFLLAAEDRDLLFADPNDPKATAYRDFYGMVRLRMRARRLRPGDRQDDLWQSLRLVFSLLGDEERAPMLGLTALGGIFDPRGLEELNNASLTNAKLIEAIHHLSYTAGKGGAAPARINYRDMNVEELGSVYESLLEMQPVFAATGTERKNFGLGASGERKSTGSYYTNDGLVRTLIESALEPVIAQAVDAGRDATEKRAYLLELKVCDPACGSGHFLLAAARRIGLEIARVDAEPNEPSPEETRHAVRETIAHCIYGVDLNPLAVDLCKVALWLEAHEPGKPLGFMEHRIRQGNSLIGATRELVQAGVPEEAFKEITGDDKTFASAIRKQHRTEAKGQLSLMPIVTSLESPLDHTKYTAEMLVDDSDLVTVRNKEKAYQRHVSSAQFRKHEIAFDLWTAAFFWPMQRNAPTAPTHATFNQLLADPLLVDYILQSKDAETAGLPLRATVRLARKMHRQNHFFHWELEFPEVFDRSDGGFDCILGNPSWDQVQLDPGEFFAIRDPDITAAKNFAARSRMIEKLQVSNPALHVEYLGALRDMEAFQKFVHESKRYPRSSFGRLNTAPLFTESTCLSVRQSGMSGIVVPTGIATDSFNQHLFGWLVNSGKLAGLFDFENREGIFPAVDSRMKFSLLICRGDTSELVPFDVAFFLTKPEQLSDPDRRFTLSADEIELLNPNTRTCPIFRTRRDAELTKQIYQRVPILIREGENGEAAENPWGIKFKLMFMMNTDSHLFRTREQLEVDGYVLGKDGRFRKGSTSGQ